MVKTIVTFGGEESTPFMDQMYKQGGVTQITASRSKGQSAPELLELLKQFTGYAAHHDPPVPATPTKLQAVDASS